MAEAIVSQTPRNRGRPRLGDVRVEVVVPQAVFNRLLREESTTGIYRTRLAAQVLCRWAGMNAPDCRRTTKPASDATSQSITAYH
jgi:hypothetical protein